MITKKYLIFDWGDTIMRDLMLPGPMRDWDKVEYVEGAEKMLEFASNHFTCCIATSAAHSNTLDMVEALKRVGADKFFKHFFSSADLGFRKPDPKFFSEILKKLNAEPMQCISIGNLYQKDIAPAKDASLTTIWFNEKNEKGHFPKANHIISIWDELPGILRQYHE